MQYVTRYIGPAMLLRPIPREGRLCSGVDMHSPFAKATVYPAPRCMRAIGDRGGRRRVTLFSLSNPPAPNPAQEHAHNRIKHGATGISDHPNDSPRKKRRDILIV